MNANQAGYGHNTNILNAVIPGRAEKFRDMPLSS